MRGSAQISDDRNYRYLLTRSWSEGRPKTRANFVMLNPSTADGTRNDPTIRRCISFSKRLGVEGLFVTNLYALRATDPRDLVDWGDPIGPENNQWITYAQKRSKFVVMAWGNSVLKVPGHEKRIGEVLRLLGYPFLGTFYCFGWTARNQPRHPLMLSNQVKLVRY